MNTVENIREVVIIGSGPAGYSAAIYAARANLRPLMISGFQEGGQLVTTTEVENYPGFATSIQGPWLMEQMKEQSIKVGVEIITDNIVDVTFSSPPFSMKTEMGKEIRAKSVILATGAQAKWLGIESEEKFKGYGVSACATCDGFFFKGKRVLVVGGGNTAAEEALYLTNHASEVIMIHRKDKFRCEKITAQKVLSHPKIKVIWNSELNEVLGKNENNEKFVTGACIINNLTQEVIKIQVEGIFIAIGHTPATFFLQGKGLMLDNEGYIEIIPGTSLTNISGVFAAGDVADKIYKQAITAAGMGCIAALDVIKYLEGLIK